MEPVKPVVRLSVRALVETTWFEPDLSPAAASARRMQEGAVAHRARQAQGAQERADYRAEAPLTGEWEGESLTLRVQGRADALYTESGLPVVEEIKLSAPEPALNPAHRAQAAVYAHFVCAQGGYEQAICRVYYADPSGHALRVYEEVCTAAALRDAFDALCRTAAAHAMERLARIENRDASLQVLRFPFPNWRVGQKKFAANVFAAIRDRKRLFAQAPTGIGKTAAALTPALLALREGDCGRVLFLTARNTGRAAAMDALGRFAEQGLRLLAVEIAAKDKVCPLAQRDCRPEACPMAKGFYERLPQALSFALSGSGCYTVERVRAMAEERTLCPFELSLSLAQEADAVVCDVNYVYDPGVRIEALLHAPGGAALLVDEAHQLSARVRDAYSVRLSEAELRELRRALGKSVGRRDALYRALGGVISALHALPEGLGAAQEWTLDAPPEEVCEAMRGLLEASAARLAEGGGETAADCFALASAWKRAEGRLDERWAVLGEREGKGARLSLLLLDASPEILAISKQARGAAYFSATLLPLPAAARTLGREEGDLLLALPSPFDPARLSVRVEAIDLRYAARAQNAGLVARAIARQLTEINGNALIFFPSYAFLHTVAALLPQDEGHLWMTERRGMTEAERAEALAAFQPGRDRPAALLCVLGGSFAESIDLPGERLMQVIVVSTGMPQPDAENRALRRYYDGAGEDGFAMAMRIPGMIRVIQAAGRLIRTEEDTGSLLLIDARYGWKETRALLAGTLIGDALGLTD